ncbi:MAG: divergent PAP2 family protein [Candidatus Omnitrophica bacterium]|nr:divergent PAP2 family protein [Candidatus Omnitrophota bacterium]MBU1925504.1 divergent PAP2 family protein [Candidatus Omnitrophota bacterium]
MQIQGSDFFAELIKNRIIGASFSSWIAAQSIKVVSGLIKEKRFDFRWIMETGGMPSAHSAGVSALATAVGLYAGFDSVVFAITAIFALIIMFDAQGLRRMSGLQAEALNRLIEDIYLNRGIKMDLLKELIGHTPIEVFFGAMLGIWIAVLIMTF